MCKNERNVGDTVETCSLLQKCSLDVHVNCLDPAQGVDGVNVAITGKTNPQPTKDGGRVKYEKLEPDTYTATISLGDLEDEYMVMGKNKDSKTLRPGEQGILVFLIEKKYRLRIILIDKNEKPLQEKKWNLNLPIEESSVTEDNGLIEVDNFSTRYKSGKLLVTMQENQNEKSPPVTSSVTTFDPSRYPPIIIADEFEDTSPEPSLHDHDVIEWELKIGTLPPCNESSGVEARLHNLAFACSVGTDGAKTKQAVKAYQLFYHEQEDGSGIAGHIQDDIKTKHDDP